MFVNAIETVAKFTRPIHSIGRNYGSTLIQPGAATLFFINADGWSLTCRHVAQQIILADKLLKKRNEFDNELQARSGEIKKKRILRELEQKYGFNKKTPYELYNSFINCVEGLLNFELKLHNNLDIALIKFNNFTRLLCDSFPVFTTNGSQLKQGKFLCRLGFPFVEFTNFAYDSTSDKIHWTDTGIKHILRFPLEGMVLHVISIQMGRL